MKEQKQLTAYKQISEAKIKLNCNNYYLLNLLYKYKFCCEPCLNVFARPCQEAKVTPGSHTGLEKLHETALNYAARNAFIA